MPQGIQFGLAGISFGVVSIIYTDYSLFTPGVPIDQIIVGIIFAIFLFLTGFGLAISSVTSKDDHKAPWAGIIAFTINTIPFLIYFGRLFLFLDFLIGRTSILVILLILGGLGYIIGRIVKSITGRQVI